MSDGIRRDEARVIAMLNVHLHDETKDFGKIVDYIVITEGSSRRYVFVTDSGRRIDANSAMRFRNAYLRRMENRFREDNEKLPQIVYPEGTTTAMRKRAMRVKRSGSANVFGNVIHNVAKVDGESISITSHMSSSDEFDEENDPAYAEKIEKARREING